MKCSLLSFSEDECRRHLDSMARNSRGGGRRRTSPPQASSGSSGSEHSPTSTGSNGSNGSRGASVRGRGYSGAAARVPPAAAPVPALRRRPPAAQVPLDSRYCTPLQQKLAAGVPLLVLMRGLPGSGKSTLSKQLAGRDGTVVSADDFFINRQGHYVFQPTRLGEAHERCQQMAWRALSRGCTPVVVDNTNTEAHEMLPYVKMAAQFDYYVELAEPTTPWRHDPRLLAKRSVHNVPERTIERMMDRFQGPDRVSVHILFR